MRTNDRWIGLALAGGLVFAAGAGLATSDRADSSATEASSSATEAPKLDGGKVYAWNCGSCHSERWPKERTDAEWDVITTHMRVRANLTAEQAEAVRQFLRGNN